MRAGIVCLREIDDGEASATSSVAGVALVNLGLNASCRDSTA